MYAATASEDPAVDNQTCICSAPHDWYSSFRNGTTKQVEKTRSVSQSKETTNCFIPGIVTCIQNKAINIITADSPETIQTLSVFLEHAELAYLADEKKPLSPIHIPLIFHALDESRIPGQEPDVPRNVEMYRLVMAWRALQDLAVVDVLRTESGTVAAELWKSVHRWIHYWYHAPPQLRVVTSRSAGDLDP